jgi:hypothetical protein
MSAESPTLIEILDKTFIDREKIIWVPPLPKKPETVREWGERMKTQS